MQYGDRLPLLSPERDNRRYVAEVELTPSGWLIIAKPGTVSVRTEASELHN